MAQYLNDINVCLLEVFASVMESHNYKLLLIDGDYNEEDAGKAWFKLYDDYNDAVKSKSVNLQFELTKQIEIQRNEYQIIKNCLFLIVEMNNLNIINGDENHDFSDYIKIINGYGFGFDIKKGITAEFERVKRQIRNYVTRIESDIKKIEELKKDAGTWSFYDTIGIVEKFMGFQMNEKTTVKKFVTYLNQLINSQKNGK